jgi:hypothetical protein
MAQSREAAERSYHEKAKMDGNGPFVVTSGYWLHRNIYALREENRQLKIALGLNPQEELPK